MMREILSPCIITSRLMEGVQLSDGTTISIEAIGRTSEGRVRYRYFLDFEEGPEAYSASDLRSGCGESVDHRAMLATLLNFLGACAESFPDGENADLFPREVGEWARGMSDELAMLRLEIEDA